MQTKPETTPMQTVHVEWRDSRRYLYQMTQDEPRDVCTVVTCGWLIEETDKHITIAQDIVDGDIRGVEVIPKENVVSTEVL